jgi:dTDP-4-dehydrorhamnose 3,5-epimerase
MQFRETALPGAWVIELERIADERGWFARSFDREEFLARGMSPEVVQCNVSFNARRGTLRGMHLQAEPHGEPKLVRCVRGSIFDVAVDLRPRQPTFCRWVSVELSAENGLAFYIPAGMAHGFQTLSDDCEVLYQMGSAYVPEAAGGVRWDDPAFGIEWPPAPLGRTISAKDRAYEDFKGRTSR